MADTSSVKFEDPASEEREEEEEAEEAEEEEVGEEGEKEDNVDIYIDEVDEDKDQDYLDADQKDEEEKGQVDLEMQRPKQSSIGGCAAAKARITIRSLLDDIASKPTDRTVKICLSRLDVKHIRRMAKATKAAPAIHRTRKSASEWLMKWASAQRASRLLASASLSHAAPPQKLIQPSAPLSGPYNFAPHFSDLFHRVPLAMQQTPPSAAHHVGLIHRQQHQQFLTYMSCLSSQPANALPATAALSPASLLNAQMQCATDAEKLQQLIALGHLQSNADLAWLLLDGREGVAKDPKRAFGLVQHGASMGCPHCLGVLSSCRWGGLGCEVNKALSWQLASSSAAAGSRYGFWTLGVMHRLGEGGAPRDYQQALQFFNMAAVLNLDAAQFMLGYSYFYGLGIAEDHSQAMRWFNMAAAQGHPDSCYMVGRCMELANQGAMGRTNAIRWYQRAFAAGHPESAVELFGQTCSS